MSNKPKNSVLIIDDSQFNITAINQILSPEYTVYVARNGHEGINTARSVLPDVILLDIIMEGLDGFEVITRLKSIPETRETPVIFITGLNSLEDEEKGLTLDAADYISKPFSSAIVKFRVRNQIQIVNQIRTIKHLSMFDTLTEIPNRRSFNDRLNLEWHRAKRERTPIGILMMDLDRFKAYNDTYGHLQGDILLKKAAETFVQSTRRATDFVARWGGEEFAVLLAGTDKKGTAHIAEKIRVNIENMVVLCSEGRRTSATISIGANNVIPELNASLDFFISCADTALYRAKDEGRNRLCFCED